VPSAAQVRAALTPGLASPYLGSLVGVEVADLTTGRVLFRRNAGLPLLPASTAKLATATAALAVFGDSARLVTKVVALGTVRGGVLHGDLVLVGGGDQLLATGPASHGEYPQAARISGLAAQVAAAGIREVTGRVLGDGALFSGPAQAPGWKPDYVGDGSVAPVGALEVDGGRVQPDLATSPRVADPALAAAADLTVALRAAGVRGLQAPATTAVAPARLPARALATVAGPPLSVEVESMLTRSDDDLAESLGRLLAIHAGLPATFAGAAQAVTGELSRLGLPTAGLRLADTSGLSILDRVPARLLVAILRLDASASHPGLRPVLTGLPVAAFSGTLVFRFRTPPATRAAGLIHAKTGTLDNVTALAGTVVDRQGREVVFAILSNSAPDTDAGEAATDVVAAAIAGL
jgi:D-alanyl-D-alanine carboxypeptidase/D-alanyl-D-alanine-endopeptidase (penicillin-binding protein 4)